MNLASLRPLLVAYLLVAACTSDGGVGVLVVVQETNLPDEPDPCPGQIAYQEHIVRECQPAEVRVVLCADEELCDEQIDAILAPIIACDETRTSYDTEPPVDCP